MRIYRRLLLLALTVALAPTLLQAPGVAHRRRRVSEGRRRRPLPALGRTNRRDGARHKVERDAYGHIRALHPDRPSSTLTRFARCLGALESVVQSERRRHYDFANVRGRVQSLCCATGDEVRRHRVARAVPAEVVQRAEREVRRRYAHRLDLSGDRISGRAISVLRVNSLMAAHIRRRPETAGKTEVVVGS